MPKLEKILLLIIIFLAYFLLYQLDIPAYIANTYLKLNASNNDAGIMFFIVLCLIVFIVFIPKNTDW